MKRVITGLLLGFLFVLLLIYTTGFWFSVIVVLIAGLALFEYCKITINQDKGLLLVATLLGAIVPLIAYLGGFNWLTGYLTFTVFFLFIYCLFAHDPLASVTSRAGMGVLGITYISFPLSHLILLRELEQGSLWILLLVLITAANDTFAFYTGRWIGRLKLSPVVSPNKTVEGALGGVAGGIVAAIAFRQFSLIEISLNEALLLAILLGIAGQFSDLFESLIKRSAGVKDSGNFLPGHGGVLDRIDSLIFPGPFLYYYLVVFKV